MKKYDFANGFVFDAEYMMDVSDTEIRDMFRYRGDPSVEVVREGLKRARVERTLSGKKVAVVPLKEYSGKKRSVNSAIAEFERDIETMSLGKKATVARQLLAYYTMPREAWVERKECLRRLEAAGSLESAEASTVRIMVGEILYRGFLAAHRLYNSGEDAWWAPRYAPASEISACADAIAERKSVRYGLGRATRKECAAYLKTYVFDGSSGVEDHANGLLWAEKRGVAERVYGAHIAEAFRTALGSLGYGAADLEDLGGLQHWPVRQLDELGKLMLAQLEEA